MEINDLKSPSLLVGNIYRNPVSPTTWLDDFVLMIDKANDHRSSILLIGDFDIDLCNFQLTWNITTSLFGFDQLVRSTTRITSTTATLIDYIYSNNQTVVSEVLVSTASISDHSPIFCIWSFKLPKRQSKGHTSIEYRSFKNFDVESFLSDVSAMPFDSVFNYNDPSEALTFWYNAFLPVVNKHAPLRRKRVKHPKLPPWLTKDII